MGPSWAQMGARGLRVPRDGDVFVFRARYLRPEAVRGCQDNARDLRRDDNRRDNDELQAWSEKRARKESLGTREAIIRRARERKSYHIIIFTKHSMHGLSVTAP